MPTLLPRTSSRRYARVRLIWKNPAVTLALLRLNAVVGVKGTVNEPGQLARVGITCALCHSSSMTRLRRASANGSTAGRTPTLNVGAIVALSPAFDEMTKAEFRTLGPRQYDPRHHAFDGTNSFR